MEIQKGRWLLKGKFPLCMQSLRGLAALLWSEFKRVNFNKDYIVSLFELGERVCLFLKGRMKTRQGWCCSLFSCFQSRHRG